VTKSYIKTIVSFVALFFVVQPLLANHTNSPRLAFQEVVPHNLEQFIIEHRSLKTNHFEISLKFPGKKETIAKYSVVKNQIIFENYNKLDKKIIPNINKKSFQIESAENGAEFLVFVPINDPIEIQSLNFDKKNYFFLKTDKKIVLKKNNLKAKHAIIQAAQMHNHKTLEINNLTFVQSKNVSSETDIGFYNDIDGKIVAQHIHLNTNFYNFGEVCSDTELHIYGNGFDFENRKTKNPFKAIVHAGSISITNINKFVNQKEVSIQTAPKEGIEQNILISAKSFENSGHLEAGSILEFGDDALPNGAYVFEPLSKTKSQHSKINAHMFLLNKASSFESTYLTGKSDDLINFTHLSFVKSDVVVGNLKNRARFIVEEDFNVKALLLENSKNSLIKAKNIYINKSIEPVIANIFTNDGVFDIAENCEINGFDYVKNNKKISVGKSLVFETQKTIENVGLIYSLGISAFNAKEIYNHNLLALKCDFTLHADKFENTGIIRTDSMESHGTIYANEFKLDGKIFVPKLRFAGASLDIDTDIRMNGLVEGKELVIATDCLELNKSGFLHVADVIFEKAPHTMNFHGKVDLKSLKFPENQKVDFNLSKTANIHVTGPFTINSIGNVLDGDLSAESITLNTDKDIIKTGTFVAKNYISFSAKNIKEHGLSTAELGYLNYTAKETIAKTSNVVAKLDIHFEAENIQEEGKSTSLDTNITYVALNNIIKSGSLIAKQDLRMSAINIHDSGISSALRQLSYNATQELKIPEVDKIMTHNIHLAMGKDFTLTAPFQMKNISINAGNNFTFESPLQADKIIMHSQGKNINFNQLIVAQSIDVTAKNAVLQQNDVVFVKGHSKLDVDSFIFNKTYFLTDSLQLDVIKECENYMSVIDVKKKATINAHSFLTKTLKGKIRSAVNLPEKLAIDISSYAALSHTTPYVFVGDDATFDTQEFENGQGKIQCNKDLTLSTYEKFTNLGEKKQNQGIYVIGKATLNFKTGENINNAPIRAAQIEFINISNLSNTCLIKATSGIDINDAKNLTNHETGSIEAATFDIKKIQNLTNDGILIAQNHFNLTNANILSNHKKGKIQAKSITIDTAEDILPILQTTLNNEGSVIAEENFVLNHMVKLENFVDAIIQASVLDIRKIEDVVNNGEIIIENNFDLYNPNNLSNLNAGKIQAKSFTIDTPKNILPILKTTFNNKGSIVVIEKFTFNNGVKFENEIDAKVTSIMLDILKIEDVVNNGSIVATHQLFIANPKSIHNTKSGIINTALLTIAPQKEIEPRFKTFIQNDGKIFATEKLVIESALKLENNEDALINSNDIVYEGNVVENTNGSIIGTNNINFDLHEAFVNKSTRINKEKIEALKKTLLETKQLDTFDGIYSQGTLTIKDGCKTYDNSALLYVSALDVDGGGRFDNSGFVTVLQRLDLKNFKNVTNQTNAIIQAVDINIYTQEFTNNGFYTAITSIINAPIKLDHKNGHFAIAESATFDFGDSKMDALFASEGKVVLKGGSLELNQNVQVKELEIITTKKLTLTDKALIKAETILLNGKEIENNGFIHGKTIDLKADELTHLKGIVSAKEDLNFEVIHTISKSSMLAENIYNTNAKPWGLPRG
jgi:hypothetical protein